jgi:hypothetical protein
VTTAAVTIKPTIIPLAALKELLEVDHALGSLRDRMRILTYQIDSVIEDCTKNPKSAYLRELLENLEGQRIIVSTWVTVIEANPPKRGNQHSPRKKATV